MNEYEKKYFEAFKASKTDEDTINIINKIYEDGFQDGTDNAKDNEPEAPDYSWGD